MIGLTSGQIRTVLVGLGYQQPTAVAIDRRTLAIGAVAEALLRAEETLHAEIVDEAAEQLDELRDAVLEAMHLPANLTHQQLLDELKRVTGFSQVGRP